VSWVWEGRKHTGRGRAAHAGPATHCCPHLKAAGVGTSSTPRQPARRRRVLLLPLILLVRLLLHPPRRTQVGTTAPVAWRGVDPSPVALDSNAGVQC
jgi:hypothetical protein